MPKSRGGAEARPSIHNVAAYAGVSIATVSKVMQGVATVRPENVVSVQNAIEALGYRINPLAAELRRGQRKLIGAIVPDLNGPVLGNLIVELEKQAEARGFALATTTSQHSEPREVDLVNRLQDWRVAGALIVPVRNERSPASLLLKASELPVVFLDRVLGRQGFDTVSLDYVTIFETLSDTLHKLGHHKVIVALDAGKRHRDEGLAKAFCADLKARDIKFEIFRSGEQGELRHFLTKSFDQVSRPTAFITFSSGLMMDALNEANARRWTVPNELSLFSFEDDFWMASHEPRISALQHPVKKLAVAAVELLFARIDNGSIPPRDLHAETDVLDHSSLGPAPA